jgi:integrase
MSRRPKGDGSMFPYKGGYRGYVTRPDGGRVYFTAKTKAEAGAKKRELAQARDNDELVPGGAPTVEQWMRHWLQTIADLRPTTRQTHEWVIERKIAGTRLGMARLNKLTPEHAEQWIRDLGVKPASVRRYVAPVRASLNVAIQRGHLRSNPFELVVLPKRERSRSTSMSAEDVDAVLAAAADVRNRARWHLALRLGLRPGEALGLTWPDFDRNRGVLRIRHQLLYAKGTGIYLQDATKTAAGARTIRLPQFMIAMLEEHRQEQAVDFIDGGWVGWEFDGHPVSLMFAQQNGRPIQARMDTAEWKALLAAAGLPPDRRYVMRHTAATHMLLLSGGDVALAAKQLGHADSSFTYRTYIHPLAQAEEELAAAMDGAPYAAPYRRGLESAAEDDRSVQEPERIPE